MDRQTDTLYSLLNNSHKPLGICNPFSSMEAPLNARSPGAAMLPASWGLQLETYLPIGSPKRTVKRNRTSSVELKGCILGGCRPEIPDRDEKSTVKGIMPTQRVLLPAPALLFLTYYTRFLKRAMPGRILLLVKEGHFGRDEDHLTRTSANCLLHPFHTEW